LLANKDILSLLANGENHNLAKALVVFNHFWNMACLNQKDSNIIIN